MRDGTRVTGSVLASSTAEITIAGDDQITRTIPMSQVKSVEYGDAIAAAAPAPAAQPAETTPPPAAREAPAPARQEARSAPAPTPREPEPPRETRPHPEPAAIETKSYTLPAGTDIAVRTDETIDSGKAADGQAYAGEVSRDVRDAAGAVVIPKGSNAQIVIKSASKGGRFRGASDLILDLRSISVSGRRYRLDTADVRETGKPGVGANRRTAEHVGGGAAIGAIIGAIAGGGKGAAIGAGAGAGAGGLAQVLTKGGAIRVPAETVLTFRLDSPLRVTEAR